MVDHLPWELARYIWNTLQYRAPSPILDDGPGAVKRLREEPRRDSDDEYIFVGDELEDAIVFTQSIWREIWFHCPREGLEFILQFRTQEEYELAIERIFQALRKLGYGVDE